MRTKAFVETAKSILEDTDLTDTCEEVSEAFVIGFGELGCHTVIVRGDFISHENGGGHCWMEVEGVPIDFTVSQFGSYENGILSEKFYNEHYRKIEAVPSSELTVIEDEDEALLCDWALPYALLQQFRSKTQ
ncbi:hypothetical protein IMZ31_23525 (plasmid) [Pontibacillus sp. ALD_SL1]|uniref:hypothetical protein n=1 Tax=Pontibacillus sp. ALD_SL1 TaxID=2777185 RepID=UPI001A95D5C1|nr:hypothetical protein [Pontibacillus sp. ALD_SL1]QST02423.1 hypothetical protein IMZ31_23525 [Pontibacillus sp. ALD_SL1]